MTCKCPTQGAHVCPVYIVERGRLIKAAVQQADAEAGRPPMGQTQARDDWRLLWDRSFHTAMERLWRERRCGQRAA